MIKESRWKRPIPSDGFLFRIKRNYERKKEISRKLPLYFSSECIVYLWRNKGRKLDDDFSSTLRSLVSNVSCTSPRKFDGKASTERIRKFFKFRSGGFPRVRIKRVRVVNIGATNFFLRFNLWKMWREWERVAGYPRRWGRVEVKKRNGRRSYTCIGERERKLFRKVSRK